MERVGPTLATETAETAALQRILNNSPPSADGGGLGSTRKETGYDVGMHALQVSSAVVSRTWSRRRLSSAGLCGHAIPLIKVGLLHAFLVCALRVGGRRRRLSTCPPGRTRVAGFPAAVAGRCAGSPAGTAPPAGGSQAGGPNPAGRALR